MSYDVNNIETLSFREGVRTRIAMYLGSADMFGVYNAIQEIISNSIDEFYMGFGNKIEIKLSEGNRVSVRDYGRGVPFGKKEDGTNVLVSIYSTAHTGGKFNDKVYSGVAGLNGIGAKATCLSSSIFTVESYREGKMGKAEFQEGVLKNYSEKTSKAKTGTYVEFVPDEKVYNVEPINIDFNFLCEKCKNLSYLTKGLTYELVNVDGTKKVYCAKDGLLDLIKDNVTTPIHKEPIYITIKDGQEEAEVVLQWTTGKEKSYTFTNGLYHSEGGTSLTGVKTAITNFMKKKVNGEYDADILRTGLVYAVSCKTPNPSFSNQTKSKINNTSLRGLAQRATTQALTEYFNRYPVDAEKIANFLTKIKKAEHSAEQARKQAMQMADGVEKTARRKVFASDKLKDAEHLGPDSTLLIVEGNSAASSMAVARDVKKYGILGLRGKPINTFSNEEEKIYQNEEIKLLLSAMNIIPGKYDSKKLRYGKIAICSDADSDGYHIGLLVMAALQYFAPQFIQENRLCWLRSPLWIIKSKGKEYYYYDDAEYANSVVKGEAQRNKGLGSLSAEQAHDSMFTKEFQRMDILVPDEEAIPLLYNLMGDNVAYRRDYVFKNVNFKEISE